MPPPPRPRTPAAARGRAGTPPVAPKPTEPKHGMDLYQLLSAVVGAFAGLVFYSVITPGHLPDEPYAEPRDPKLDLVLRDVRGRRDPEGYFRVSGRVVNAREVPCERATVGVSFKEGERELSRVVATVEDVAPGVAGKAFEVRAFAPRATVFDATVELAQF